MSEEAEASEHRDADWPLNYFNYFTEIEESFQRARGTGLFLLSPLDWALIESWRSAGIPLEAVLKGIDDAFQKWRSRKQKHRLVNSLAYCSQAVLDAAQRAISGGGRGTRNLEPPFTVEELRAYLANAARILREKPDRPFQEIAASLEALAAESEHHIEKLEELERRLAALEDKLVAAARSLETDESLFRIRQDLDSELKPYRSKMTAEQLAVLERRYLDSVVLEQAKLPRLSLFYLR
ncbi:MAG: hypothetical protein JOY62_04810 [Acidobacteriaceae bacterium]|nr:hypothetical protein [Acidobacteriaceae bacterium]MBV9779276.1 hypothetical protein [Acidobacteriaceae bacterium]